MFVKSKEGKMKIFSPVVVLTSALIVGGVTVNRSLSQSMSEESAEKLPRKAILQGKVLDRQTGAPLARCAIEAGPQSKKPNTFEGGRAYENDKHGKFRIEVEPGRYFLNLAETRSMTLQRWRSEAAKGRLSHQRTDWKEVTANETEFRKGSGGVVDAKKGQIRTFVFRFKPLN